MSALLSGCLCDHPQAPVYVGAVLTSVSKGGLTAAPPKETKTRYGLTEYYRDTGSPMG